ncbi:unnamed protein product [Microthlaspi erraticum]|uniref:F-box domain-containing protein n=1 Tax=Microthlaspi erraticum TaxID=1685480 RepID=A0A6D2I763_9BRAS|nr:unnamed protein product [Microthlaspi erraticum]
MKTRRREYFSEDSLTVSRRKSRASTSSTNAKEENSETTISTDLITEILLRLPGKSVARSRCVSKLWNSTLRDPYFTELFLTMSLTRPRLLFSFVKHRELYFFSAPQGESSSSPVSADYHVQFKLEDSYRVCGHILGLVCLTDHRDGNGRKETAHVIWTRKLEWRMIECGIPSHYPTRCGICINGGVYYEAWVKNSALVIVCFDVRLEKCRVINAAEGMDLSLGTLTQRGMNGRRSIRIATASVKSVAGKATLYIVGVAGGTDEVVLWSRSVRAPLYVYYYNMERNTFRRVEIKGMDARLGTISVA